jgi:pyrroline-5-carboxylate reductase
VIAVNDEEAYAALGTSTAIMATHFAIARTVVDWLSQQGVDPEKARDYISQLQSGLARTAEEQRAHSFHALEAAHATPGSFNDYLRTRLAGSGTFRELEAGLNVLLARMRGR